MALDPNLTFFTADFHFGDDDLYTSPTSVRPFRCAEQADEFFIKKWNSKVPTGGTVCVVGDISGGRAAKVSIDHLSRIISQLNGTIILILGNHDDLGPREYSKIQKIVWVGPIRRVSVADPEGNVQRKDLPPYQEIVLFHYPMRAWEKKTQGAWHLFGHMHNNLPPHDLSFDVGVDTNKGNVYSYAEVKAKMKSFNVKMRKEHR